MIMMRYVDFIFGREILADDKKTALVKYAYAYQEIKNLIQERKIIYKIGIFGKFNSISWKQEDMDKIVENMSLIAELS